MREDERIMYVTKGLLEGVWTEVYQVPSGGTFILYSRTFTGNATTYQVKDANGVTVTLGQDGNRQNLREVYQSGEIIYAIAVDGNGAIDISGMLLDKGSVASPASPTAQPLISVSLDHWTGKTDQGWDLTKRGANDPEDAEYEGKACVKFGANTVFTYTHTFKPGGGTSYNHISSHLALTGWVAVAANTKWKASNLFLIAGFNSAGAPNAGFGTLMQGGAGAPVSVMYNASAVASGSSFAGPVNRHWHHWAINFRVIDPIWTSSNWEMDIYVDGVLLNSFTTNIYNRAIGGFILGNYRSGDDTVPVYIRDVRAYTNELTAAKIKEIYDEGSQGIVYPVGLMGMFQDEEEDQDPEGIEQEMGQEEIQDIDQEEQQDM